MLMAAVDVAAGSRRQTSAGRTDLAFHDTSDIFFVCAEVAAILRSQRSRWSPGGRSPAAFVGEPRASSRSCFLVGPVGWAAVIFGLPIWTLGTSLFVLLRSPERMRAAAVAA